MAFSYIVDTKLHTNKALRFALRRLEDDVFDALYGPIACMQQKMLDVSTTVNLDRSHL